jgi:DNA-binding transcriptional ArsR family regulator
MRDTDHRWNGDINEAVVEEWKSKTTPFERVREVLLSTTTPQYAKEIAERARVSEPTARKHLNLLTDSGVAATSGTGQGTQYKRSRQAVAMRRISDLHTELSREALTEGIKDLRQQIQTYQNEYHATSPDDLALQLESGSDEGWAAVSEWRALEDNLDIAQAALALYDFTPDRDDGQKDPDSMGKTQNGSFAGECGSSELSI